MKLWCVCTYVYNYTLWTIYVHTYIHVPAEMLADDVVFWQLRASRKWLDWLRLRLVTVRQPWTELQYRFLDSCGGFPEADLTFRNTWNFPLTGTSRRKHRTDSTDSCSLAAWLYLIYPSHTYVRILCVHVHTPVLVLVVTQTKHSIQTAQDCPYHSWNDCSLTIPLSSVMALKVSWVKLSSSVDNIDILWWF